MADFILPSTGAITTKMVREHFQEMGVGTSLDNFTRLFSAAIYSATPATKPYNLSFFRNYRHDNIILRATPSPAPYTTDSELEVTYQADWRVASVINITFKVYSNQSGSYQLIDTITANGYGAKFGSAVKKYTRLNNPYNLRCDITSSPTWSHNGVMSVTLPVPAIPIIASMYITREYESDTELRIHLHVTLSRANNVDMDVFFDVLHDMTGNTITTWNQVYVAAGNTNAFTNIIIYKQDKSIDYDYQITETGQHGGVVYYRKHPNNWSERVFVTSKNGTVE
jgi:hypothetical protein